MENLNNIKQLEDLTDIDEDLEPLTKPKSRKTRSQKQIESFNIALKKRAEKIEERKKEKLILASEILLRENKLKNDNNISKNDNKKVKPVETKIHYDTDTNSDEEIIVVKSKAKAKKPKKKVKKVIIEDSESDSDSGYISGSGSGSGYKSKYKPVSVQRNKTNLSNDKPFNSNNYFF